MPWKTKPQEILAPFLEGGGPDIKGEWNMHCIVHADEKRSASINFDLDKWYCHACLQGGTVSELLRILDQKDPDFVPTAATNGNGTAPGTTVLAPVALPSGGTVAGWHAALVANSQALGEFRQARGLSLETIIHNKIGMRHQYGRFIYTLPIYGDQEVLQNVRFYDLRPGSERRKIWGIPGHNTPLLFPIEQLSQDKLVICEGEWDALIAIQNGIPAITRTGAAKVWKKEWNQLFVDKTIYICHDMDRDGQIANRRVMRELRKVASSIGIVKLPFRVELKHGRDITDYFHVEGHEPEEFLDLIRAVKVAEESEYLEVELADTNSIQKHGSKTLSTVVNFQSAQKPPYSAPRMVEMRCGQDAGKICSTCPMNSHSGSMDLNFKADDATLLEMTHVDKMKVVTNLRQVIGIPKCALIDIDVKEFWDLSLVTVRSSVDHAHVDTTRLETKQVTMVGSYIDSPNTVFQMVGNLYPHPKTQATTFQVSRTIPAQTSIDSFVLTPEIKQGLEIFQGNAHPLEKAYDIAEDLSRHITHIYGRSDMHVLMDLVYHSVLSFSFAGTLEPRGWLDALIIGDTRTGKSEAASSLVMHYQAGEMVNCEGATFAGILGGVQQVVGNTWEISWGVIPQNDRRMVTLDEASSLSTDQFAQLSGVRSSGEAQITKIRSDKVQARTRLLWLANPRPQKYTSKKMEDFTYGVDAVRPLIENSEDIARFDIAMAVRSDEVDTSEINKIHSVSDPKYSAALCQALVLWAWSRRADQIVWTKGAVAATYRAAMKLGEIYIEDPPLIQSANVRMKIARLATALAARTFSTDDSCEKVLVKAQHVAGAVQFIDNLYGNSSFGYKILSVLHRKRVSIAAQSIDEAKEFIHRTQGLADLLFESGNSFRGNDIQETLGVSRDVADGIVKQLAEYRMIKRGGPQNIIQPLLRDIVRELIE